MAEIDKRALRGLCAYRVVANSKLYERTRTFFMCDCPIDTSIDELLCPEHHHLVSTVVVFDKERTRAGWRRRKKSQRNNVHLSR